MPLHRLTLSPHFLTVNQEISTIRSLRARAYPKATFCQSLSLPVEAYQRCAILREISNVTSYLVVRWVFRPLTQLWKTICTSVLLRTSISLSTDFILVMLRSLPFGFTPNYSINWVLMCLNTSAFAAPLCFPHIGSQSSITPWSVFRDGRKVVTTYQMFIIWSITTYPSK